jgi:hypothetical protein
MDELWKWNGHRTRSGSRALKHNSQMRQQIHLLLLNPFLVPLYGRGIVSHEIEFSFLDSSHDTHTCDVGHRRSEGNVA